MVCYCEVICYVLVEWIDMIVVVEFLVYGLLWWCFVVLL